MWKTTQLGVGAWSDEFGELAVDARGGADGIAMGSLNDAVRVQICEVDEEPLPIAGEQFIKEEGDGDQWHINFPQGDARFALRLTLKPIESNSDRLVMETCLSVQTDLLDSHPKLDLQVDCNRIESWVPQDKFGKDDVRGPGSAAISTATSGQNAASIILGPQDQPFTTNHSTDMLLRLRLFGDFLEKGVIRRGRPWIVLERNGRCSDSELERLWNRLRESPLPLA